MNVQKPHSVRSHLQTITPPFFIQQQPIQSVFMLILLPPFTKNHKSFFELLTLGWEFKKRLKALCYLIDGLKRCTASKGMTG